MDSIKEFPFSKARRITLEELKEAREAIEHRTGKRRARRGRPPKAQTQKYRPISIRLHPIVYAWVRKESKRRHVPYQTIINEILLREAA